MLNNISSLQNNGFSPLHGAGANDHDTVVAVLLSNGANVNQADNNGDSPLQRAAWYGYDAVVTVLLSNGADVNQTNKKGQKPIVVASNQKIKDMLIAHTKKQQQQQPPPLSGPSSVPVQSVNVNDRLHSKQGLVVSSDEVHGQLEVAVAGDAMMIMVLLLDEFIAAVSRKTFPLP